MVQNDCKTPAWCLLFVCLFVLCIKINIAWLSSTLDDFCVQMQQQMANMSVGAGQMGGMQQQPQQAAVGGGSWGGTDAGHTLSTNLWQWCCSPLVTWLSPAFHTLPVRHGALASRLIDRHKGLGEGRAWGGGCCLTGRGCVVVCILLISGIEVIMCLRRECLDCIMFN